MKTILTATYVLLTYSLSIIAQQPAQSAAKLEKDKPSVYVTFERLGKAVDLSKQRMLEEAKKDQKEKGNDVWLRIHNNTCWSLYFSQFSMYAPKRKAGEDAQSWLKSFNILEEGAETGLFYWIVGQKQPPVFVGIDSYTEVALLPGNSLLFSVPREHLSKERAVRVDFRFAWESHLNEPLHAVTFRSYDLDDALKELN